MSWKDSGAEPAPNPEKTGERIAKRLSRAGLCSRREAERWIAEGRVAVDGKVLTSPAVTVTAESIVAVDGKIVGEPERARLFRYNKPKGLVSTPKDAKGRPTIFDRLPKELPRLMPAGALEPAAEGLMLLTNDGALKRHLELPATGWLHRYRCRVFGAIDEKKLAGLAKGAKIGGIAYGPIEAAIERRMASNAWLVIGLVEGKDRDVKRVIEYLGVKPSRIIRIAYGPFQLGNLPEGALSEVTGKVIREQVGAAFAPAGAAAARRSESKAQRDRQERRAEQRAEKQK
jgi:23S rRNA pseudouridine2605 synthase